MAIKILASNEARAKWGYVQYQVVSGQADIIVQRHGRPSVVLIPYNDFVSLRDELADLRAIRRAAEAYTAWKENPDLAMPYEDFQAELVAEGLLVK